MALWENVYHWLKGFLPQTKYQQEVVARDRRAREIEELDVAGHGGLALGSVKAPNLSPENMARWSRLLGGEVRGFVYEMDYLPVHSSNVFAAQYFVEDQKLMLEFKSKRGKPNRVYLYSEVTEEEALDFARAPSKGRWVWLTLRVLGDPSGTRKPFVRIR